MKKAAKKPPKSRLTGKPNGRPPIISEAIQSSLIAALQHGAYIETAAAHAGINKETFYAWMKRGARAKTAAFDADTGKVDMSLIAKQDVVYVEFSNAIVKAISDSELIDLQTISKAAQSGQWQAAAWRLERKNPKKWGRQSEDNADLKNVTIFNTLNIDVNMLSDEKLNQRIQLLLSKAGDTYEHEDQKTKETQQKALLIEQGKPIG